MSVRPSPPRLRAPRAALASLLVLTAAACGSEDDGAAGTCGEEVVEPVDPQSAVHVLPGAPEQDGGEALPTSGIHVMDPSVDVVSSEPLPDTIAVGVLERRGVVIEHSPDLPADEVGRLEALASEEQGTVVVAPAPDLPSPVVARAWRTRLECTTADVDRLETFIDEHLGTGSAMSPDTGG